MDDLQGAAQVAPVVNTSVFGEAPLSIAECSPETSASSVRKIGERSSPCGIGYRCELEPLWLPADLMKEVQMGDVRVRELREWIRTSRPSGDIER